MRGTRLVQLPCNVRYSENGTFKEDCAITLTAPSLDQFSLHNTMVTYAMSASRAVEKDQMLTFASLDPAAIAVITKARAEAQAEAPSEPVPETDAERTSRVISHYAQGLGDKFPAFMDFLKKSLTNNPTIARIGDTKNPIRDETWNDLAEKGGMDAVNMIFAGFAGFFLKETASTSRDENGNSSRPTSPSQAAVH